MAQQTFKVDFMRYAPVMLALSGVLVLVSVLALAVRGLNFGIDFTGGTLVEVQYPAPVELPQVQAALAGHGLEGAVVQYFGTRSEVLVRIPVGVAASTGELSTRVLEALASGGADIKLQRVEFVGPQVGDELAHDGLLALLMVVIGIMIYLAFRFEWKFSVAAIIANLHDVVLVIGVFAIFGWEFSLPVLAAVLAVLGYSVNESVIIFDRVREHFRKMRRATTVEVIDSAITATISRTMITHGSTLMMTLAMLFFGGPALHYFALALTIGILFGIYSSVLVASPLVMWLGVSREQFIKAKVEKQEAVV